MQLTPRKLTPAALLIISLAAGCVANTPRTCYSCSGINCLRTTLQTTEQCLDPLDYCVTIFEKFNVVQKGCSLGIPIELRSRCDANGAECHKCNTDRCNNLGQANFQCLQCDSSQDANCAKNAAEVAPTRCAVPTAPNSYCFVQYAGGVTTRGCSGSVTEQQSCYADGSCMLCLPGEISACNRVDFAPGTRAMQF